MRFPWERMDLTFLKEVVLSSEKAEEYKDWIHEVEEDPFVMASVLSEIRSSVFKSSSARVQSHITPFCIGNITETDVGVLPSIAHASLPAVMVSPVILSNAITEASSSTSPLPFM